MSSKFEKLLTNYVFNVSELCQVNCLELCQVFVNSPACSTICRDTLVTQCYEVTSHTCNTCYARGARKPSTQPLCIAGNRGALVYIVLF